MMENLLEIRDLQKIYRIKKGFFSKRDFYALRGVTLDLKKGEILGIVGESGSGKTTLAKVVLRLERPEGGMVTFKGRNIFSQGKDYTRHVSVVFQDPRASLNPRMTVREILEEPLLVHGIGDRERRVKSVLETVQLGPEFLERKPEDLSGGQRQRVAIARALILEPEIIVSDEPTASLDVSVQSEILGLFLNLKKQGFSIIFITHDIRVVEKISDRIAVFYGGMIMEMGDKEGVLSNPLHPYTRFLLGNVPVRHPSERREEDFVETSHEIPQRGCPFNPRCPEVLEECQREVRRAEINGRIVTCNLY